MDSFATFCKSFNGSLVITDILAAINRTASFRFSLCYLKLRDIGKNEGKSRTQSSLLKPKVVVNRQTMQTTRRAENNHTTKAEDKHRPDGPLARVQFRPGGRGGQTLPYLTSLRKESKFISSTPESLKFSKFARA